MSRYISKLPPEIRELAEKRRSEQRNEGEDELRAAFLWYMTLEGEDFWREINKSNYSVFYTLYPQKDKLDELIEWIEVEIIWHKGCESDLQVINSYETILNKAKEIKGK